VLTFNVFTVTTSMLQPQSQAAEIWVGACRSALAGVYVCWACQLVARALKTWHLLSTTCWPTMVRCSSTKHYTNKSH
jgi:hypothetical protein